MLVDRDGCGRLHGTPLVEDPDRVGKVQGLGIDETSILSANREHSTVYVTGMVDLNRRQDDRHGGRERRR